jgi:hypothetical protein
MSISSTRFSHHELHGAKPLAVTFSTAKKITGLGLTKLWQLGKQKRIEIVHVDRRTLITYRSLEKLLLPEPLSRDAPQRRRGRPRKSSSAAAERTCFP